MIYTVIYQSQADKSFDIKDIDLMLIKARQKNKSLNITGCIVYANNKFVQIIQGEEKNIKDLYKSISSDNRHKNVTTLFEGLSEEELWKDWSMVILNFSGDSTQIIQTRVLLESYFASVDKAHRETKAYKVFHSKVIEILSEMDKYVVD